MQAVAELRSQNGTPVETPTAQTTEAASFHVAPVRVPLVQSMIEEAPIAEDPRLKPERKPLEALIALGG